MAKYQKYAEYKDSGFNAFGEIPSHWEVLNLRYVFDFLNEKRFPLSALERAEKKGSYPYYGASGIIDYVDEYILDEKTILIAEDGANLLSRSTPLAFIADGQYWVNNHAHILKPKNLQFGFWTYFLQSLDFTIYITGSAQPKLSRENLGDVVLLKPSLDEQVKIANFLDHETAQIDTLITKQEKLIELLKEKRQAVISHAVTKGLNPDVKMKDSGVEWLGQVPEHWQVIKFNHCVQIRNGLVDPKHENYKNLILYAPNHIEKGTGKILYKETAEEQGADSNKYLCFKGEVIYSKIRPALAKVVICEEDLALCSADMYPMDGFNGLSNKFLYYFILSDSFTEAVILDSDRVAMPKINRESLSEYKLPIPPLEEQKKIIDFIETTGWNLDKLEQQAHKAIQLMQERRTALISSAVTGKINVTNWQNPQAQIL